MSTELMNEFSRENEQLKKQIGCMNGILQVFNRRRLLTGRRSNGHNKKRVPSGRAIPKDSNHKREYNPDSPRIFREKDSTKISISHENRRVSMESFRDSSSSSSSSLFSSLECSKTNPPLSPNIHTKSIGNEFRNVVKDSINGETRALSVKTSSKEEVRKEYKDSPRPILPVDLNESKVRKDNVLKYKDSPRPILSVDLNESLRVLVTLKEAPWSFSEAARSSCDGREISRRSSGDSKYTNKLRELPRLSLDSKASAVVKEFSQRVPSVVAKLMGLEALPSLSSASQEPKELAKINTNKTAGSFSECNDTRKPKNVGLVSSPNHRQNESIYSQIGRRVIDQELCDKDYRALRHILNKMQAKEEIESKKGLEQNFKANSPKSTTPRVFESPIVIMKPAKSFRRSASQTGQLEGLSGLQRIRTCEMANRKKDSSPKSRIAKDQSPKANNSIEEPLMQRSPRPQQSVRHRSGSIETSPRAQKRSLELENKPRSPTQRQSANRQLAEPVSPRTKLRVKPSKAQQNRGQLKELSNEVRGLSNLSLTSQFDAECVERHSPLIQQTKQKKSLLILREDALQTEVSTAAPEQPSPISVLDSSFYQDDLLPSPPAMKMSNELQDDIEHCWIPTTTSKMSSEADSKKLDNIKSAVQKLRQLIAVVDDERTEEPGQDQFLSRILLACGLRESTPSEKPNSSELHQQLMLDITMEILARKMEEMNQRPKANLLAVTKKFEWEYFVRELCSEIERVGSNVGTDDESLILNDDVLSGSEGREDIGCEVPEMVLEIERLIFKDLMDEFVIGEAYSGLQAKPRRQRRRQLFADCVD